MPKITQVEVLRNYRLALSFDNGVQGVADLSHLAGRGVFKIWKDYKIFREVRVGEAGELIWKNDIDLCPDSLYLKITGNKPEDLFPGLKHELANA